MKPKIILFDEPTSTLDPDIVNEMLDAIIDLTQSGIIMPNITYVMGFA